MAKRSKKRESTRKINVPITIAIVLFYLTLVSIYLTSGIYAKYTTQDRASDGARVMSFGGLTLKETLGYEGGVTPSNQNLVIIPGVNLIKDVEVTFDGSEADTYIFVEAEMKGWTTDEQHINFHVMSEEVRDELGEVEEPSVPYMSVSISDKWKYLTSDGEKHVYYQLLESNTKIAENAVDFIANGGLITVSPKITKAEIVDMTDIQINITAYAAQAGGFENAEKAWASISH